MKLHELLNEGDVLDFTQRVQALKDKPISFVPGQKQAQELSKEKATRKAKELKKIENNKRMVRIYDRYSADIIEFFKGYVDEGLKTDPDVKNGETISDIDWESKYVMLENSKEFLNLANEQGLLNGVSLYDAGRDFWKGSNLNSKGYTEETLYGNYSKDVREALEKLINNNFKVVWFSHSLSTEYGVLKLAFNKRSKSHPYYK